MTIRDQALALWRAREMTFPRFVRRMTPDRLDDASGAWARVMLEAAEADALSRMGRGQP